MLLYINRSSAIDNARQKNPYSIISHFLFASVMADSWIFFPLKWWSNDSCRREEDWGLGCNMANSLRKNVESLSSNSERKKVEDVDDVPDRGCEERTKQNKAHVR